MAMSHWFHWSPKGSGLTVQSEPDQWAAIGGPEAPTSPAPVTSSGATATTDRNASPPSYSGCAMTDQVAPFQCTMSPWSYPVTPTAQTSEALVAETPYRMS